MSTKRCASAKVLPLACVVVAAALAMFMVRSIVVISIVVISIVVISIVVAIVVVVAAIF